MNKKGKQVGFIIPNNMIDAVNILSKEFGKSKTSIYIEALKDGLKSKYAINIPDDPNEDHDAIPWK